MTDVPRRWITLTALALALAWAGEALSHAYLVRSRPQARATLARAPERVELWFNERLEPTYSRMSVWNATGQRVDAGDGRVAPAEPTQLSVSVPPLPAGTYTVRYRVLSVDGHLVESEFAFTVRGGP